jgi:copper homeostasis protein
LNNGKEMNFYRKSFLQKPSFLFHISISLIMNYILETIAFNIESCKIAQAAGVHRIELCDNPTEGGTTPSYGFIKAAREALKIQLYPIIRPRGGDFLYTNEEFEIIKADVLMCKELGCDGVVIGMLNADATIDKVRCALLINIAYPMGVTFHRAFDRVSNMQQALEDVIEIGCERILTSGLYPAAKNGVENIAALIKQADNRITIMLGSGIRGENIAELAKLTNAKEFHSSARIKEASKMSVFNETMIEKLETVSIDIADVKLMLQELVRL